MDGLFLFNNLGITERKRIFDPVKIDYFDTRGKKVRVLSLLNKQKPKKNK